MPLKEEFTDKGKRFIGFKLLTKTFRIMLDAGLCRAEPPTALEFRLNTTCLCANLMIHFAQAVGLEAS